MSRRFCVFVMVGVVLLSCVALVRAAELSAADKAALADLKALVKPKREPKGRDDYLAMQKAILPQLEAFAENNANNEAGAQALLKVTEVSWALGDTEKGLNAVHKFLGRFPKHLNVPHAKFMKALVLYKARAYDRCKRVLADLLEKHPESRRQDHVTSLVRITDTIGTEAKEFQTTDLAAKPVKLSDFRGRVVLLHFYAGWCPPCGAEMPDLVKVYEKYKDRGFEIVGISLARTLQHAKAYAEKQGMKWAVTWQAPGFWKNPVAQLYGVRGIPATYLLDKKGKVRHRDLRSKALNEVLAKFFPAPKKPAPKAAEPKAAEPPQPQPKKKG